MPRSRVNSRAMSRDGRFQKLSELASTITPEWWIERAFFVDRQRAAARRAELPQGLHRVRAAPPVVEPEGTALFAAALERQSELVGDVPAEMEAIDEVRVVLEADAD